MAIPALPDTERLVEYTVAVADDGPFSIPFHIYADDDDPENWIEVWLDGEIQTGNWTLTSLAGGADLSIIARPITDARITFDDPITGELQIVGARRPRQASQFINGQSITADQHNRRYTDLMATARELFDKFSRAFLAPVGEAGAVISGTLTGILAGPASATANAIARWNGTSGAALKNSEVTIDDSGNMAAPSYYWETPAAPNDYVPASGSPASHYVVDAGNGKNVRGVSGAFDIPGIGPLPPSGQMYLMADYSSDPVVGSDPSAVGAGNISNLYAVAWNDKNRYTAAVTGIAVNKTGTTNGNVWGGQFSAIALGNANAVLTGANIECDWGDTATGTFIAAQLVLGSATGNPVATPGNSFISTVARGSGAGGLYGWRIQAATDTPIHSTGSIVGIEGPALSCTHGIDLSAGAFATSAFRSPGFTVAGDGKVTIETNAGTVPAPFNVSGDILHLCAASTVQTGVMFDSFGTNNVFRYRRANGTPGAETALADGQSIGSHNVYGHDGTSYSAATSGGFAFQTNEAWNATSHGTRFIVNLAQNGATAVTEVFRLDKPTTATQTGMMLWDVDNGTLERVTVGAADSGGAGFKVLRIPN
jgi:hypothetical protein